MNDLQCTFLILSASFSSPSCCFSSGITSKIVVFSSRLHGCVVGSCCVKTGSVFPAFCHATFYHSLIYPTSRVASIFPGLSRKIEGDSVRGVSLITCCNVSRVENYCSNVSQSGYIWFLSRPRDQESTNGSPCLVEWKFRNITMDVVNHLVNVRCCHNNRNKA